MKCYRPPGTVIIFLSEFHCALPKWSQLTSSGSVALSYDARGNLATAGSALYFYTAENRLALAYPG